MRRVLQFTSIVLVGVALYTSWVFFSRWRVGHKARQQQTQREAESARRTVNAYGGDRLTILSMTINPPVVAPGEPAMLCYGVSNAKTMKIIPAPEEEVWPSMSRCVQIKAQRTTEFRLIAEDANGHVETAVVPLTVR